MRDVSWGGGEQQRGGERGCPRAARRAPFSCPLTCTRSLSTASRAPAFLDAANRAVAYRPWMPWVEGASRSGSWRVWEKRERGMRRASIEREHTAAAGRATARLLFFRAKSRAQPTYILDSPRLGGRRHAPGGLGGGDEERKSACPCERGAEGTRVRVEAPIFRVAAPRGGDAPPRPPPRSDAAHPCTRTWASDAAARRLVRPARAAAARRSMRKKREGTGGKRRAPARKNSRVRENEDRGLSLLPTPAPLPSLSLVHSHGRHHRPRLLPVPGPASPSLGPRPGRGPGLHQRARPGGRPPAVAG